MGRERIIQGSCQPPSTPLPSIQPVSKKLLSPDCRSWGEEREKVGCTHPAQFEAGTTEEAGAYQAVNSTFQAYNINVWSPLIFFVSPSPASYSFYSWVSPLYPSYSATFLVLVSLFLSPHPIISHRACHYPLWTLPCQCCHLSQLVPSPPPPTTSCLVPFQELARSEKVL